LNIYVAVGICSGVVVSFSGIIFGEDPMLIRSIHFIIILIAFNFFMALAPSPLRGQQKAKGPPPASVSVAEVKNGRIAPRSEFIATVFYQEISETASETSGLATDVRFEEGRRVKKGQILVALRSDILRKRLLVARSNYEQALSELEIARIDLKRRAKLFEKKSISAQTYDENRYRVIGSEKRASSSGILPLP
jgi:membrane fusion protein (multidrug efflux system)